MSLAKANEEDGLDGLFMVAWPDLFDREDADDASESMQMLERRGAACIENSIEQRRFRWQSRDPLRSDRQERGDAMEH
jgi:hypothetical protein